MPFRFFDHTGDIGVDLDGADQAQVVRESVRAFAELLTGARDTIRDDVELPFELEAGDAAELLVALGNELVYCFEADGFLATDLELEHVDPHSLRGSLVGEDFDPQRHPIACPMKAVTHHEATCEPSEHGWRGRLIFDL